MNGNLYQNPTFPMNSISDEDVITPINTNVYSKSLDMEQSYIENILRQMPFLNLMPTGDIKLNEVVSYLNAGAVAVGVGRDFYLGFTPSEITARTKEIMAEVKDFTKWNKK